ncbi:MAG: YdcF family protein [Clostridia bacterium]
MNRRIIDDITNFIFINDKPQKADIIMIPGASSPDLPEYAAELYKQGFSNKIIPAGKYSIKHGKFVGVKEKQDFYNKEYLTECDFYCDVLKINGVSQNDIICEDMSMSTRENAIFSKAKLDEEKIDVKTAIIVCKAFHARRCLMYYQLAFPNTEFIICPVNGLGVTKENWWTFDYGIKRVLGEVTRIGNQFNTDFEKNIKGDL